MDDRNEPTREFAAAQMDTGTPARGTMDQGALEPLGRPGLHHWRQATIVDPTLDERGGIFFAVVEMTGPACDTVQPCGQTGSLVLV